MHSRNLQKIERLFPEIMREIRNCSKVVCQKNFFVSNNFVLRGSIAETRESFRCPTAILFISRKTLGPPTSQSCSSEGTLFGALWKMSRIFFFRNFWRTFSLRSRPGKPNQRKGQNKKFMNFAHFCEFWCFSLGKQARFTLNFCSGMRLRKVHELTFFGLVCRGHS